MFGLDAYETSAPGSGGVGGAGGEPAQGGAIEGGAGGRDDGSCVCDLAPIWRPMRLAVRQAGSQPAPDQCDDGSAPTLLFVGAPPVECASCSCTPEGCEPPALLCFHEGSCQGTPDATTLGSCSSLPGGSCVSMALAGEVSEATCTTAGGEPLDPSPPWEELLAFCTSGGCGEGCADARAQCVVAEGLPAAECPRGFDVRYALAAEGVPTCQTCECSPFCQGPAYTAGALVCDAIEVDSIGCESPGYLLFQARREVSAACDALPATPFEGTFEVTSQQTACCREPIAGLNPSPPN